MSNMSIFDLMNHCEKCCSKPAFRSTEKYMYIYISYKPAKNIYNANGYHTNHL